MAAFSQRQWAAISVGVLFFASLYFINCKPPQPIGAKAPTRSNSHAGPAISMDSILSEARFGVPVYVKNRINKIMEAMRRSNAAVNAALLDSVINIYDSAGAQLPAALYTEKLAALKNSTGLWYRAGHIYYRTAEVVNADAHQALLQRAMQCFDNSLKLDSNNLEAAVGKGECIVEGAGNPMEGIMMIEGVLKKDSNNEKAQVALGRFSIQSGQNAKAIHRFNKVLKIDPAYSEAYLYLAQASQNSGDTNAAIAYLKKYSTFVRDTTVKNQVNSYILKLENNKTGQ